MSGARVCVCERGGLDASARKIERTIIFLSCSMARASGGGISMLAIIIKWNANSVTCCLPLVCGRKAGLKGSIAPK